MINRFGESTIFRLRCLRCRIFGFAQTLLKHALALSKGQLKNVFLLRQAYLQKQAVIEQQGQKLQHQIMFAPPSANFTTNNTAESQAVQQMQETTCQLHDVFLQYIGVILGGVSQHLSVVLA